MIGCHPISFTSWNYFKKELSWVLFIARMLNDLISRQKNSPQRLGFIFIFEIIKLIPLEHKPAGVPRLDKASLFPQPPTLDGALSPLALGALCGVTVFLHSQADGFSLPGMRDLQGMAGGCSDFQAPRTGLKMSSSRQGALYFPGRARNPIRRACVLLSEEARAAAEPQLRAKLGGLPESSLSRSSPLRSLGGPAVP